MCANCLPTRKWETTTDARRAWRMRRAAPAFVRPFTARYIFEQFTATLDEQLARN
jgi:hypothetical protein